MNYMKRFAGLVCAVAAIAFFASCSKDKESGTLSFDSPAVFLSAGQTVKVGFKAVNLQNLSVTNKPTGWVEPAIDFAAQTLTITAPVSFEDDEAKTGSLVLAGSPKGGSSVSATLFVGVVNSEDLSGKPANSYIVSKPETNYLISSMFRGDLMAVLPASVDVVWQSKSGLIQYAELREDGMVSFYVGADSDDEKKIKEGNAVIGAYDAGGTLMWSWHIWAVNYDPEASAVDFNGLKMMDRNLGALANDNSTVENILASYGLYYQWGRKDPFIGPSFVQRRQRRVGQHVQRQRQPRLHEDRRHRVPRSGTMDLRRAEPADVYHGRFRLGVRLAVERPFRRSVGRHQDRQRPLPLRLARGSFGGFRQFARQKYSRGGRCRQIRLDAGLERTPSRCLSVRAAAVTTTVRS